MFLTESTTNVVDNEYGLTGAPYEGYKLLYESEVAWGKLQLGMVKLEHDAIMNEDEKLMDEGEKTFGQKVKGWLEAAKKAFMAFIEKVKETWHKISAKVQTTLLGKEAEVVAKVEENLKANPGWLEKITKGGKIIISGIAAIYVSDLLKIIVMDLTGLVQVLKNNANPLELLKELGVSGSLNMIKGVGQSKVNETVADGVHTLQNKFGSKAGGLIGIGAAAAYSTLTVVAAVKIVKWIYNGFPKVIEQLGHLKDAFNSMCSNFMEKHGDNTIVKYIKKAVDVVREFITAVTNMIRKGFTAAINFVKKILHLGKGSKEEEKADTANYYFD